MIAYPHIDPVLVKIGPLAIRWYSLAYIAGLILGLIVLKRLHKKYNSKLKSANLDDYFIWVTLGVILGGRLGYVLFYDFSYFIHNPVAIFKVWHGGMSFHGGLSGVIISTYIFCKKHQIPFCEFTDKLAIVAPFGLFFGRIANFINGELWGRPTNVPWAMIFPTGGNTPRHPSQLYEAFLEGILTFIVLFSFIHIKAIRQRHGMLTGVFLLMYGSSRFFVEFFRQPDAQVGYLIMGTTMGQLLSLPLIFFGIIFIFFSFKSTKNIL